MNSALTEALNGFFFAQQEEDEQKRRKERYRDALRNILMEDGEELDKGHRSLSFKPMTIGDKTFRAITAQRRVSASIDLDKTEALVRAKDAVNADGNATYLLDKIFPRVTTRKFDEDALYIANQQGLITDAELDSLITENVTFAIVPVKS